MSEVIDKLTGLMNRGHTSQMLTLDTAHKAHMLDRSQRTAKRMETQADNLFRRRECMPQKDFGVDEGMGVIINNGIVADAKALQSLVDAVGETEASKQIADDAPIAREVPQSSTPTKPPLWKRALTTVAKVAAIAAIGAGGAYLATKFLPDSDSNSVESFEVQAIPFDPNQ